jgi:hypothetical protein
MKGPPKWLPGAHSRKWHSRRWWDSLGYIRVRTLTSPNWHRDADWLIRVIQNHRPRQPGLARDAIDDTLRSLREYRALSHKDGDDYAERREAHWDAALDALDRYLATVQEEHMRAVHDAGKSGSA